MSNGDLLSLQDVYDVTATVHRTYRRVMAVVVVSNLLVGLLVTFLLHALASLPYPLAALLGGVIAIIGGVSAALHWVRHYRSIFSQLAAVEARLVQGESLYGSDALAVAVLGYHVPKRSCPKCNTIVPSIRMPRSFREAMLGGWHCQTCGTKMTRNGVALPD